MLKKIVWNLSGRHHPSALVIDRNHSLEKRIKQLEGRLNVCREQRNRIVCELRKLDDVYSDVKEVIELMEGAVQRVQMPKDDDDSPSLTPYQLNLGRQLHAMALVAFDELNGRDGEYGCRFQDEIAGMRVEVNFIKDWG